MPLIELFYSDTCPDCHMVREHLMKLMPKDAKFKEINIGYPEGRGYADSLGIMSVPTVVIDGDVVFVGYVASDEIEQELKNR